MFAHLSGRIITISNILALPKEELAAKTRLSGDAIAHLYAAISKKLTEQEPCSVFAILNNPQFSSLQVSFQWLAVATLSYIWHEFIPRRKFNYK